MSEESPKKTAEEETIPEVVIVEKETEIIASERIEMLREEEKEKISFDPSLLGEVAGELGITDPTLLKELLAELTGDVAEVEDLVKGMKESTEKILAAEAAAAKPVKKYEPTSEYETGRFQNVSILPQEDELLYTLTEPVLSPQEQKKMQFAENVFDRLIGIQSFHVLDDGSAQRKYLNQKFDEIARLYNIKFRKDEKERIFYYLERNFLKYGKLDVMMNDRFIEDISCNGPNQQIYVYHREHGSVKTSLKFSESELNDFILRLSQLCGKHVSILNPIMDAALPDGSRINLTLGSEVTKKGSSFTIRKFKKVPISPIELMNYGSANAGIFAYVWMLLEYGMSVLVSGGTASGKTTLLNAVCMFVKPQLKIVSIEDTPEINIEHPNWLQSVSRMGFGSQSGGSSGVSSVSGLSGLSTQGGGGKARGEIGLYDLLVAALRQRPDYIIVGEVRGSEAFTMFQAIAVGHACMGTIHARNMQELVGRVESVPMSVPRTLFSNVDLVLFVTQIKSGDRIFRRVMEAVEVLELSPETKGLVTNPVYKWNAKDDSFDSTGSFMLFDKIAEEFGLSAKDLREEHARRTRFLLELAKQKITNHVEFTKNIVAYYKNAERLKGENKLRDAENGALALAVP